MRKSKYHLSEDDKIKLDVSEAYAVLLLITVLVVTLIVIITDLV